MNEHKKTLVGSILGTLLSLCGCGQTPPNAGEPALVEEIAVTGSLWIHFEAMPPFFAEDEGTESEFDNFEEKIQDVLGVSVARDDREVFVIQNPESDTAEKAKAWLEAFRT